MLMKRLWLLLVAAGTALLALAGLRYGARRQGEAIGRAEGQAEADLRYVDGLRRAKDERRLRDDILKRMRKEKR